MSVSSIFSMKQGPTLKENVSEDMGYGLILSANTKTISSPVYVSMAFVSTSSKTGL